jgi:hypothetical protein
VTSFDKKVSELKKFKKEVAEAAKIKIDLEFEKKLKDIN